MPMHRRRVYIDRGASRRARIEGWFAFSIYVSAAVLLLSLIVCLPEIISSTLRWLAPERPSYRFGALATAQSSILVVFCEILTTLSGAYLAVALLIKSNTR